MKLLRLLFAAALIAPLSCLAQCSVSAGSDITFCQGGASQLLLAGGGTGTLLWVPINGTGSITNAASATTTYNTTAADFAAGTVTMRLYKTDTIAASCGQQVFDDVVYTIVPDNTINAGPDQTVCNTNPIINMDATVTGGAISVQWNTGNGTGTFGSPNGITNTYTATAADILQGSVDILVRTVPQNGCGSVSDIVTIHFAGTSTVNAGTDKIVCGTTVRLDGSRSGMSSTQWSSSGTGTFNNSAFLDAIYTFSNADILAGSVNFTLTSTAPGCGSSSDFSIVTIPSSTKPICNAGADFIAPAGSFPLTGSISNATGVSWGTLANGTFDNSSSMSTNYNPSASELANGYTILSLTSTGNSGCPADIDYIKIQLGTQYTLSGSVSANSVNVTDGLLLLIKYDNESHSSILNQVDLSTTSGTFTFNVTPGNYKLFAIPGLSLVNNYLPTFNGNIATWSAAGSVSISSSNSSGNAISLIPYTPSNTTWKTGADVLYGNVALSGLPAARIESAPIEGTVANAVVYLTEANNPNAILGYTVTDGNGNFSFSGLKSGTYSYSVEYGGYPINSAENITLDGNSTTKDFSPIKLYTLLGNSIVTSENSNTNLLIYPMPADNEVTIEFAKSITSYITYSICDMKGQPIVQGSSTFESGKIVIPTSELKTGMYLLQFKNNGKEERALLLKK